MVDDVIKTWQPGILTQEEVVKVWKPGQLLWINNKYAMPHSGAFFALTWSRQQVTGVCNGELAMCIERQGLMTLVLVGAKLVLIQSMHLRAWPR